MALKDRAILKFPAIVTAATGIGKSFANGVYNFYLDYRNLASVSSVSDATRTGVVIYTPDADPTQNGQYNFISLGDISDITSVNWAAVKTLTNTTFDTAGSGNVFQINGTQLSTVTGTGSAVLANSPSLTNPNLGTPSSITLTNGSGLPVSTGISGLASGISAFLGAPSSANLLAALTTKTGTGSAVFGTSPNITTPTGIVKSDVGLGSVPNIDATNASNISSGTLPAARLPNPSPSTLGGIQSAAPVAHKWINSVSTSGVPALSQPDAADVTFTQSGTGAVASLVSTKIKQTVTALDFGAVGDGVTDDTAAVNAAIAALGAAGGTIVLPNGCFHKISGSGAQIFLITAPIRFVGPGFGSAGFVVTGTTSSTTDIFRIAPATNTTLYNAGMTGLQVVPLSGTPGRHVWNFDTTTGTTTTIAEFLAEDCYFGAFGNYTFFNNTGVSTSSGGIYSSHFVRNVCAGSGSATAGGAFGGANWGDSNHINGGRMAGTGYAINISLFAAGGAGNFLVENANIVSSSMIKIEGGYKPIIQNCTIEQQLYTNTSTNNAVIDLNGGVAQVINPTIVGNLIVVGAGLGNPTPLRINNATTTVFDNNRFSTPSAYAPVVSTASASSIVVGAYNAFSGTGALSFAAGTVAINLAGGQIPATVTNDNAIAGYVGEYVSSSIPVGSAVSLVNTVAKDVTTITLNPGDWDVWGSVWFNPAGTTTISGLYAWVTTTANTLPTLPNGGGISGSTAAFATGTAQGMQTGSMRLSVASPTTVSLGALAAFGVSTMSAYGFIGARRRR